VRVTRIPAYVQQHLGLSLTRGEDYGKCMLLMQLVGKLGIFGFLPLLGAQRGRGVDQQVS
jgi:hypothetical protein